MSAAHIVFGEKWESQTFTSNGTFNVPDDVSMIVVEMYGAGGGGADAAAVAYGGFAGEYVVKPIVTSGGASFSVTLGTGGTGSGGGASGTGNFGSNGGDTQFGSFFARGGFGGRLDGISQEHWRGGTGRGSVHASGGANDGSFLGGNGGYEAGGNGNSAGAGVNGGRGAGGGGGSTTGGNGGDGIVIVYWKKD